MTIAITGATGQLGRLVIGKLKDQVPASDIVALARSPEKAADLAPAVRRAPRRSWNGASPAMIVEHTIHIEASPDVVWRVTVDVPGVPENPPPNRGDI